MNDAEETWWPKKAFVHSNVGYAEDNSIWDSLSFSLFHCLYILSLPNKAGLSIMVVQTSSTKGFMNYTYCLAFYYPGTSRIIKKKKIIFQSWSTVLEFVKAFMRSCYLSGVLLLPCSFISNIISEESSGELALASRRSCSCWARYWAGVCLANRAQWSSSLCSRGRLAFSGKKQVRQTSLH